MIARILQSWASKSNETGRDSPHGAARADVISAIGLLRPQSTGHELIRIGGANDGGYLVPADLNGVGACLSAGVSNPATFELDLAERFRIPSLMTDGTVARSPIDHPMLSFTRRNIGWPNSDSEVTLERWVEEADAEHSGQDYLLQIDIEGAEYEAFTIVPREVLQRFRIIVVEYHKVQTAMRGVAKGFFLGMLRKLSDDFAVAHIHPNNCCGVVDVEGIAVPKVLEVTYIRRDRLQPGGARPGPRPDLDQCNLKSKPDIQLADIWWRAPEA